MIPVITNFLFYFFLLETWYFRNAQCLISFMKLLTRSPLNFLCFCVCSVIKSHLFSSILLLFYFFIIRLLLVFVFKDYIVWWILYPFLLSQTQLIHCLFQTNIYNDTTAFGLYLFIFIFFFTIPFLCVCVWGGAGHVSVYVCFCVTHL